MTIVSLLAFIWPPLVGFVSGVGELTYWWQPWTAVFLHGWPGMPWLLHLAGNLALLALVGPPVEARLGSRRFLLLTLLAIGAAGVVRLRSGIEFNGASAFIWAYAPLLWGIIRDEFAAEKVALLWVMWLIVPLALGIILALNGANFLTGMVLGNVYRLAGTAVGFTAVWLWQDRSKRHDSG